MAFLTFGSILHSNIGTRSGSLRSRDTKIRSLEFILDPFGNSLTKRSILMLSYNFLPSWLVSVTVVIV